MTIVDRPIRFFNHHTGTMLLVYPVDSPEPCPQCGRRCCIFLDRRPRPLCLGCAADERDLHRGYIVLDGGAGSLVGVPLDDLDPELRGRA